MSNFQLYSNGTLIGTGKAANVKIEKEENKYFKPISTKSTGTLQLESTKMNMHLMYQMMGYKFIESVYMVDQFQNKKHHTKRINKKWAKRYGFTTTPKKDVFVSGMNVIGHPSVLQAFKKSQEIH